MELRRTCGIPFYEGQWNFPCDQNLSLGTNGLGTSAQRLTGMNLAPLGIRSFQGLNLWEGLVHWMPGATWALEALFDFTLLSPDFRRALEKNRTLAGLPRALGVAYAFVALRALGIIAQAAGAPAAWDGPTPGRHAAGRIYCSTVQLHYMNLLWASQQHSGTQFQTPA